MPCIQKRQNGRETSEINATATNQNSIHQTSHIKIFLCVSFRPILYIPIGLYRHSNYRRNCNCFRWNSNHRCPRHILDHCNIYHRHRHLGSKIPRDKVWLQVPRRILVLPLQSVLLSPRQRRKCPMSTMVPVPTPTKRPPKFSWEQMLSVWNGVERRPTWTKGPRAEREECTA